MSLEENILSQGTLSIESQPLILFNNLNLQEGISRKSFFEMNEQCLSYIPYYVFQRLQIPYNKEETTNYSSTISCKTAITSKWFHKINSQVIIETEHINICAK